MNSSLRLIAGCNYSCPSITFLEAGEPIMIDPAVTFSRFAMEELVQEGTAAGHKKLE